MSVRHPVSLRFAERRRTSPANPTAWRRFRVGQAHELRRRLRRVPAIAGGLFVLSGLTLAVRYPDAAPALLAVNSLPAIALFWFAPIAARASDRGVFALSFAMPAAAALPLALMIAIEPTTFATAMAGLAVTAIGAPLLLGWDASTSRRFEAAFGLVVGLTVLTTGFGTLTLDQRVDLASLVGFCCAIGALAGNLLQDLRLRAVEQEVELIRLNRELHGYATTDPLTRLRNRRQLDDDVKIMWPSIRRGAACSVIMLDLDHFKRLNDERGHAAGDSTLHQVALELQRQIRGRDSVYRVGGEEFLVLLRDTSLEAGLDAAERIRAAIAELGIPGSAGDHPNRLTISAGVAVADEHSLSWNVVVAAADAALYVAKAAGRNRVFGPEGMVAVA